MNTFKHIRRQNRILENKDRIQELLQNSEYGFLSLGINENAYGSGIPINYAYDEETNSLYFHGAPEGQKVDMLKANSKVSFCIVGITKPLPEQFSTIYESVIAFGQADINLSDDEKRKALQLLVKKYSPDFEELGDKYMEKSWNRTFCFKIIIEHITAKAKY